MHIYADTHAHIYPCYDLGIILEAAFHNLNTAIGLASIPDQDLSQGMLFLTETKDCNFFSDLPKNVPVGFAVTEKNDFYLKLKSLKIPQELTLVNGKQFVSGTGIEVLALGYSGESLDGFGTSLIIDAVNESRATPVLSWSPGKWTSKRGEEIMKLIVTRQPGDFLLGDIAIRARYTKEPLAFKVARKNGFKILAGSDSLPVKNEEKQIASYLSVFEVRDDFRTNPDSIKEMLFSVENEARAGKRNTILLAAKRWISHRWQKVQK